MAADKKYSSIYSAVMGTKWAMTPEALRGVLYALDRGLDSSDRTAFHGAGEGVKQAIISDIGQSVQDSAADSYIRGSTGVIFIDGPIIPRADFFSNVSGVTSLEQIACDFRAMVSDPVVTDIVLAIDSPGGNIVGVSEFAQMVNSCPKPTTAYVYGMAASAAYWIAAACHTVVGVDTAEFGSIGVVMTYQDTSKADAARGVENVEIVSSQSPYKRPDLSTDDGRASVQLVLDDLAGVFVDSVAAYRGTKPETVLESFGKGGMMAAKRAQAAGMLDKIGTMESIFTISGPGVMPEAACKPKTMEAGMPGDNKTLTAADLVSQYPEAVQQIRAEAAATERTRIQSIETLMDAVAGAPASVVSAASAAVNTGKYNPDATADSVSRTVLAAVGKANAEAVAAASQGPRKLAEDVSKVGEGGEGTDTSGQENPADQEEKATTAGLSAAFKQSNKR